MSASQDRVNGRIFCGFVFSWQKSPLSEFQCPSNLSGEKKLGTEGKASLGMTSK
jgi:hypothetical protein